MPLPTSARCRLPRPGGVGQLDQAGRSRRSPGRRRGCRRSPAFFSAFSSSTSTLSPASLAAATAASANSAGGRSSGGVLTRSRARWTASVTVCARSTAALTALSLRRRSDQAEGLDRAVWLVLGRRRGSARSRTPRAARPRRPPGDAASSAGSARPTRGPGECAAGGTGGAAQHLGVVRRGLPRPAAAAAFSSPSPTATTTPPGRAERRHLGDLVGLARAAERRRGAGQPALERLVHVLARRARGRRPGALGDAHDEGVDLEAVGLLVVRLRVLTGVLSLPECAGSSNAAMLASGRMTDLRRSPLHDRHVDARREDRRLRRLGDADRVPRRRRGQGAHRGARGRRGVRRQPPRQGPGARARRGGVRQRDA